MIDAPARAESSGRITVRRGLPADAPVCAAILQHWLDATPWLPKLHTLKQTEHFMAEMLFPANTMLIAQTDRTVRGYLAVNADGVVPSLTVAEGFRGAGVGRALIDEAKRLHPQGLSLWTFVANDGARCFYARHGFREVRRTDGDNDEGLPDILLEWRRAP
jgi:ribosomal protein S18 acetylase RimI-like enzyme